MGDGGRREHTAAELRRLIDTLPIGIVVVGNDYRFRLANTNYAALVGVPTRSLVGQSVATVIGEHVFESIVRPALDRVFDGEEVRFERPWRIEDYSAWRRGVPVPTVVIHYIPEFLEDETLVAAVGVVRDTTEERREANRLVEATVRDPLTGALNRRGLDSLLASMGCRPNPSSRTHSLCVVDLDGFKDINDACGHAVGDDALRRVAQALRDAVEPEDEVVRLGGDEFLVILAHGDPDRAAETGENIVESVARARHTLPGTAPPLTVSVGVAAYAADAEFADALRAADAACYNAKRAGGDRVARA